MGLRDLFTGGTASLATGALSYRVAPGIVSPWQDGQLSQVVWSDILGDPELAPLTRAEAMRVPAVVKARHLIVGHLARFPLRAMRGADQLPEADQPAFLYRTNGGTTPWHRMAWTVDDLFFGGWSLWKVERGAGVDGAAGPILDAVRVPPEWWRFGDFGGVLLLDPITEAYTVADHQDVILFPGPAEGLLSYGAGTLRAARNLEASWAGRVRNPVPVVELHHTVDEQLSDTETRDLVAAYVKARSDPNGAVIFTPFDVDLRTHGDTGTDTLVEARNAVRLDVANFTGLPAGALDGSLSTASLTYTTQEGTRTELGDTLALWADPIQARLSQDDVVPRGQRVRFDTTDASSPVPTPTGPTEQD